MARMDMQGGGVHRAGSGDDVTLCITCTQARREAVCRRHLDGRKKAEYIQALCQCTVEPAHRCAGMEQFENKVGALLGLNASLGFLIM